jgi:hypothetical protein
VAIDQSAGGVLHVLRENGELGLNDTNVARSFTDHSGFGGAQPRRHFVSADTKSTGNVCFELDQVPVKNRGFTPGGGWVLR